MINEKEMNMDILTNLSHQMLKGKKEEDNLLLHMYNRFF